MLCGRCLYTHILVPIDHENIRLGDISRIFLQIPTPLFITTKRIQVDILSYAFGSRQG